MMRKRKVYPLSREEREEVCEFIKEQLRKGYIQTLKVTPNSASVLCREEEWKEENGARLLVSQ